MRLPIRISAPHAENNRTASHSPRAKPPLLALVVDPFQQHQGLGVTTLVNPILRSMHRDALLVVFPRSCISLDCHKIKGSFCYDSYSQGVRAWADSVCYTDCDGALQIRPRNVGGVDPSSPSTQPDVATIPYRTFAQLRRNGRSPLLSLVRVPTVCRGESLSVQR